MPDEQLDNSGFSDSKTMARWAMIDANLYPGGFIAWQWAGNPPKEGTPGLTEKLNFGFTVYCGPDGVRLSPGDWVVTSCDGKFGATLSEPQFEMFKINRKIQCLTQ